ncbi:MAG: alpha/beta hydrolase [Proteobacteria bacterium]|nr:alpha/beta hydrolase [Pseudomonadota bacterium]
MNNVGKWAGQVRRFTGGGVPLEYLDVGDGGNGTVVFMHSLLASWKQFAPQVEPFSRKYRVICLSLRGHGGSGRSLMESCATYSPDAFADDLKALADHLGLPPFHYVGNSIGGVIGYRFFSKYPEKLKTLTTFGSPARTNFPPWSARGLVKILNGLTWLLGEERYGRIAAKTAVYTDEARQFLEAEIVPEVNWDVVRYAMVNLARMDFLPILENAKIPVLLIHAQHDVGFQTLLQSSWTAAKKNPWVQVADLAGAGHLANLDQPQAFNQILGDFLAGAEKNGCK